MKDLKDKFRISYVYITHDLSTSRYIGDKIAIMYAIGIAIGLGGLGLALMATALSLVVLRVTVWFEGRPEKSGGS
jgi:peptide/nickel transport system ATP-binding protein